MKILALDTATEACSAALFADGALTVREDEFDRGHAEHILSMIDAVLAEGGTTLKALDAIAFGRGPGGFTGVRLAASVTQGLAFGASLPVVPVSDLAAVAQRVLDLEASTERVLVCNDARMREVYWACFERREGLAVAVTPEAVSPSDAVTLPKDWSNRPFSAAGRGFKAYPELQNRFSAAHSGLLPHAREVARLAVPEVAAGRTRAAAEALPVYLRDDVARASSLAKPSS
jgi:tRNA threonylcarbamoyladenosine biosynthesis protein TsaB